MHRVRSSSRRSGGRSGLAGDIRGANLVEYILLTGVIALVAAAGFRAFGASVPGVASRQGRCVAALDASCGTNRGRSVMAADTRGLAPYATATAPPPLPSRTKDLPFVTGPGDARDIEANDVSQNKIGDCYLVAAMGEIALREPDVIRNAIHANPDGSFTVILYDKVGTGYAPVAVKVPAPKKIDAHYFVEPGDLDYAGNQELWPALVERAYAEHNGGYEAIGHGGDPAVAISALTGRPSAEYIADGDGAPADFNTVASLWGKGYLLTTATRETGDGPLFDTTLVKNHAYYVSGVDPAHQTITLRNPWGWDTGGSGGITLSYADYTKYFVAVSATPPPRH